MVNGKINKMWFWWILAAILVLAAYLRLSLLYWGYINDGFLVPPGTDPLVHLSVIEKLISNNLFWDTSTSYPQGLHIIIAFISRVFNVEPFTIIRLGTPLLVVLPAVPIYLLGRELLGKIYAFWVTLIYLLVNGSAIVAYGDGLYANLIGSYFFLPLILFFVVRILKEPRHKINYFLAAAFYIMLGFFHHMSFALTTAVLIVIAITIVIYRLVNKQKILGRISRVWKIVLIFGILGVIVCAWLLYNFYLDNVIIQAIANVQKTGYVRMPITIGEYRELVGPFVWYAGLVGVLLVFVRLDRNPQIARFGMILLSWFGVMFLASRMVYSFLPDRIARETGLPLVFFTAYVAYYLMQLSYQRWMKLGAAAAFGWLVVTNTTMLFSGPFGLPQGYTSQVRFQKMDLINLKALHRNLPKDAKVAITPASPYIPRFSPDQDFVIMPKTITTQSDLDNYIKEEGVEYIASIPMTEGGVENSQYPEFIGYKRLSRMVSDYPGKVVYKNGGIIIKEVISNTSTIEQDLFSDRKSELAD